MYEAEISRQNPTAMLFLVDQSGSMSETWGGDEAKSKAESLATIVNKLLQTLGLRCAKDDGIRDYFHVAVLGYADTVKSAFGPKLPDEGLIPISRIAQNPDRVEEKPKKVDDGVGGLVERLYKLPIWVDPVSKGATSMVAAIGSAHALLEPWVRQHPDSFPPVVFNITDGEPTDGDPSGQAESLRTLATSDGSALLFNVHISKHSNTPSLFPNSEAGLNEKAKLLFRMSSELPQWMVDAAAQEGLTATSGARGFAFQADAVQLIQILDIGTRQSFGIDRLEGASEVEPGPDEEAPGPEGDDLDDGNPV